MGYRDLLDQVWPLLNRLLRGHTLAYRVTGGLVGRRTDREIPLIVLEPR
jgi:hypothetical protein